MIKQALIFAFCLILPTLLVAQKAEMAKAPNDTLMVKKIFEKALESGESYGLLEYLCHHIGPRLSGSENAAKAVAWTKQV
ncbi:MAG: peptidase M28 family protein, partial [Calditrichia bacterium]